MTRVLACLSLAVIVGSAVSAELESERLAPAAGTAIVTIAGEGSEIGVELLGLAVSLMGFDYAPKTRTERENFRLARENLKTGDGLIRFSARAGCRLSDAEVEMGSKEKSKKPRELSANYRFECDRPGQLDSAAIGLFVAFPALQRVFVRYDLADIRGAAELNRGRPVVSFVPLL